MRVGYRIFLFVVTLCFAFAFAMHGLIVCEGSEYYIMLSSDYYCNGLQTSALSISTRTFVPWLIEICIPFERIMKYKRRLALLYTVVILYF